MKLAQAVQTWMDQQDDPRLKSDTHEVWKAVAGSAYAGLEVSALSASQAKALMGFFPSKHQVSAAEILNAVHGWAIAGGPMTLDVPRSPEPFFVART